jgi:hypothetical protein
MKALVLEAYNRLVYKEMPDPRVGPDEVLIRVKAGDLRQRCARNGRKHRPTHTAADYGA